jgi:hypothetical protein
MPPEQRDELAPFHSIISSVVASSVGGTVRPSALAVIRFTTRSNLVGRSTGTSAGLLPRRTLSTSSAAPHAPLLPSRPSILRLIQRCVIPTSKKPNTTARTIVASMGPSSSMNVITAARSNISNAAAAIKQPRRKTATNHSRRLGEAGRRGLPKSHWRRPMMAASGCRRRRIMRRPPQRRQIPHPKQSL